MNDNDTQDGLRDYYRSIATGDPVRVSRLVGAAIATRRQRSASRAGSRPRLFLGVAVALSVALVAGVGFAAWRTGSDSGLPGGPAASSTPAPSSSPTGGASTSPSPTAGATQSATPRPSPTLRAATSATPAGHFSATGSMDGRYDTATLLIDGRVLMTGENSQVTIDNYHVPLYTAAAELYDPATGKFSPTGSMIQPQGGATATRLQDGRVLIAGGVVYSDNAGKLVSTRLATAQLYDPGTGRFTATGSMSQNRLGQTATLLDDGDVLIAGGGDLYNAGDATAELYDPATGTFRPTGSMHTERPLGQATRLADGRVLMTGVFSQIQGPGEIYDPSTGTFSLLGAQFPLRLYPTTTLLRDGRVLVAGEAQDSNVPSAQIFDPATGTITATGAFITERSGHTATLLPDGRVLVAGGTWAAHVGYAAPEPMGGALAAAPLNGGAARVELAFADFGAAGTPTAGDGIPGATGPSEILSSAELYDPTTGKFSKTGSMTTARALQTATLLLDGRVLITGGDTTGLSAELYQP